MPAEFIRIADIAVVNRQRKFLDEAKLQELADSIESNGLLHPIVVRRPFAGEEVSLPFVLSVGGRRLAAHIRLGRDTIEANLKEDLDPIRSRIVELDENTKRDNVTWQEEQEARVEIFALLRHLNPNVTLEVASAEIGVSKAQLSKDLNLQVAILADPSLRQAASKGSAIRTATYRDEISRRIEAVSNTDGNKLQELTRKLVIADARTFVRNLPDQSVDMVFTDLPYGIDYFEGMASESANKAQSSYDDSRGTTQDLIIDLVPECFRVVKPTGWVVFFMCYELHGWLQDLCRDVCLVHKSYRAEIDASRTHCDRWSPSGDPCIFAVPELPPWIWTRRGSGNHGHWPELHASNRYEMLVVVNAGAARLTKKPVENVLDYPPLEEKRYHAMQKPHALCQEIISRCTVVGERVLDLCFGSGAHLAAAASMGRDFLGCDLNPNNLGSAITLVSQYWSPAVASAISAGRNGTALALVEDTE